MPSAQIPTDGVAISLMVFDGSASIFIRGIATLSPGQFVIGRSHDRFPRENLSRHRTRGTPLRLATRLVLANGGRSAGGVSVARFAPERDPSCRQCCDLARDPGD